MNGTICAADEFIVGWSRAHLMSGSAVHVDKDLVLRADIRLLGRILGDTVREQSGAQVFDTVEDIRQNSVRFRRDEDGPRATISKRR